MYEDYYGLTTKPFSKQIATGDLFHPENFQACEQRMDFLKQHGGIGVLWGPAGAGKSVALRWMNHRTNDNLYRFCYLPYPPASVAELYRGLATCLDIQPCYRRMDTYERIQNHILELASQKKITPIIALDECQMYSNDVLKAVRLFLNFEFDSRDYVILILCGQTDFRKRLRFSVYEPLVQRITTQHHFTGLEPDEVESYLSHRLGVAGVSAPLFEPQAVEFLYQVTGGVFRKIDLLATQSLDIGARNKQKTIDQPIVEEALEQNFWAS